MSSKVYFSDLRALPGTDLLGKLKKLIRAAGIGQIDFENKMVAIKIHFGEPGNLSYLRPNYAKAVADVIKDLGGNILGRSDASMDPELYVRILKDNPLGQQSEQTPMGIIRPVE